MSKSKQKDEDICRCLLNGQSYVNKLDKKEELFFLSALFITIIALVFFFAINEDYSGLYSMFFILGLIAFVIALFLPIIEWFRFSSIRHLIVEELEINEKFRSLNKDAKKKKLDNCLGLFFAPVPRRIMSLGVIPIIFAIAGIIISVKHPNVPKFPIIKIDILLFLIILGSITEAIAFFFGFYFPEPELTSEAELPDDVDFEALNEALQKLADSGVGGLDKEGLKEALKELKIEIRFK